MNYKITKAIDMFNGNIHNYSPKEKDISLLKRRYDFIFTKNKKWFYNSSTDDKNILNTIKLNVPVENKNENGH